MAVSSNLAGASTAGVGRRDDAVVARDDGGYHPSEMRRMLEVIRSRRSIRSYAPRPVDRVLLDQVFEAARWAPSSRNGQPWLFVVFAGAPQIARVCSLLDERAVAVIRSSEADPHLARFVAHCRSYFHVLRDSPVLVAACYKPSGQIFEQSVAAHFADPGGFTAWSPNLLSLGMAVQNLLLCAHAAGLGACFHSSPVPFLRGPLHELAGLPTRLELAGFLTLGWPATAASATAPRRKPLAHLMRWARG